MLSFCVSRFIAEKDAVEFSNLKFSRTVQHGQGKSEFEIFIGSKFSICAMIFFYKAKGSFAIQKILKVNGFFFFFRG